ncbi:hypothetical protein LFX25_19930 [Leptospira sp. FAT2]|uniref:hypothetical protein n=1 Tax=Leptospira sanjuanensis TaxID=2879643 RepID=UPI001EE7905D|nr:hypothetical protein [Leptospira sanjuanensis]MCG6195514.1 hypothetical protein [Leptospira sanjuanensis]
MKKTKNFSWDNLKLEEDAKASFEILLGKNKSDLRSTFRNTYENIDKMIKITHDVIIAAEINKWDDIIIIWNAIGYMLYISLESKHAIELLTYETEFDKQRLYIKNIINLIYESISDLESLLGGKLSKELIKLGLEKRILNDLKQERNKIINFKKCYFIDLQNVRNAFGGHRDHNFIEYNSIYRSIEKSSVMNLVFLYDDILNSLGKPMTEIMNESSRLKTSS